MKTGTLVSNDKVDRHNNGLLVSFCFSFFFFFFFLFRRVFPHKAIAVVKMRVERLLATIRESPLETLAERNIKIGANRG